MTMMMGAILEFSYYISSFFFFLYHALTTKVFRLFYPLNFTFLYHADR
jgi:hypothetical protein